MEYEQQPNPDDGFMNKIKESPRTVSAIIIVLIVAAAIYAFSGNEQNTPEELAGDITASVAPKSSDEEQEEANNDTQTEGTPEEQSKATPAVSPAAPVDKAKLMEASEQMPSARTTENAYVEVAERGDGLTHLARRAAARYLTDNEAGYTLTNEHRIYIEDYIRKNLQQRPVHIGMEETISFDLVKQAVEAAGTLSEPQLKNLTKYTHALT